MNIADPSKPDLTGTKLKAQRYTCLWTVLHYHRGGNWVCEEPDYHTTCHFHKSEIMAGIVEDIKPSEMAEIACLRHSGELSEYDAEINLRDEEYFDRFSES